MDLAGGTPWLLFPHLAEALIRQDYAPVQVISPQRYPGAGLGVGMFLGERGLHEVGSSFRLVGNLLLWLGFVLIVIGFSLLLPSRGISSVLLGIAVALIATGLVVRTLPSFESWLVLLVVPGTAGAPPNRAGFLPSIGIMALGTTAPPIQVLLWIAAIRSANSGRYRTVRTYIMMPGMHPHFVTLLRALASVARRNSAEVTANAAGPTQSPPPR